MCLGIPMQVVEIAAGFAWCEGQLGRKRIDMRLVGDQPPGTWVLAFIGAARELLDEDEAQRISAALDALAAAMAGEAVDDALFPDLAGREPMLPEHLRRQN